LGFLDTREYLKILHLVARTDESSVNEALRALIDRGENFDSESVRCIVEAGESPEGPPVIEVVLPDLAAYDGLRSGDAAQVEVAA
jgi:hypothetical protein